MRRANAIPRTPLTALEQSIAAKLATASFPPATASKRFARNIGDGYVKELSPRGRKFMAYVANRFRRQYALSSEERAWVEEWIGWQDKAPEPPTEPATVAAEPEPVPQGDLFA